MTNIRIGCDLGRVIVSRENNNAPLPNCFEVIKKLGEKYGRENLFIVSRVNSEQRERAIKWLNDNDFYNQTGFLKENVYFCFDRRDKVMFAAGLNLDIFIDDRPDCLLPMNNLYSRLLFNPWPSDIEKHKEELSKATNLQIVKNWKEAENILL